MADLRRRLAVARGDEPADLVIRGGRVLSVFTREWLEGDLAIVDGFVAGIGDYEGNDTLDATGRYLVPGFIDSHMHLESSKLLVDEFARLVVPLGTTAVVADPHELANVLGTDGIHWIADMSQDIPLDVFFMASSSVPASKFESPRRPLSPGDLQGLLRRRRVLGLAEMMNFPGVVGGDEHELEKLALEGATHVDGHAPGVHGKDLNAYAAAGIRSDHEARTVEEGRERLRVGMWVLIREASGARNLHDLLPLVAEFGPHRLAFCTDDREPEDIVAEGHINGMVREAVASGVTPEDALVMASLNGATWHGLRDFGALAPGYQADVLVLGDLERFEPQLVLKAGRHVEASPRHAVPDWVRHTVRIRPVGSNRFRIPWEGGRARVIGIIPDQIATESLVEDPTVVDGEVVADPERDLAKIAVVERHLGTGRIERRARPRHRPPDRGARADGRARRAQHRRRRHERPRHVPSGHEAERDRRRRGRRRGRRRPRGAAPARGRSALRRTPRRGRRGKQELRRGGASPRLHTAVAVPVARLPGAVRDPGAEDHRPRAGRRRRVRARHPARGLMLLANAWVATMDDAGSEYRDGWVLVEDGLVSAVGGGQPPAGERLDVGGALVTPGLVNTHHHLYQTLTRTRAQEADLFTWLKTLYPVWAQLDAEAEYAAARTGLAELALSGCTTVFDHHYVFPRGEAGLIEAEVQAARELGPRLVASRGSMDLGESDGGLPPDSLVETIDDVLADTERLIRELHESAAGARTQVVVAPCSPFSVTGELMTASAELARREGVLLHTHLAETVEEEAYCLELYGCRPVEYLERLDWLARTSGARTAFTCPPTTSTGSRGRASESHIARRPTCASAPGWRRCASSSMRVSASASASTGRPRTSAAISPSR